MAQNHHKIEIQQYDKQGQLQQTYAPLQNLIKNDTIGEFVTSKLSYTLKDNLNIDTQLSFDDSINLILNNNEDSPRIINSQFRTLGNNNYEYLTRNQSAQTNLYNEEHIKNTTDLYLRSKIWPIINLYDVSETGQLMGGNYVFYIKYCDEDMNESEIVSESGAISIFKGNSPGTINGTLIDERTNKCINLTLTNFDNAFSQFYIYFSRETSDLNGISLTKYYKITTPYLMNNSNKVSITGYENIIEISDQELFKKYNYFSAAKTQAIVQNMLFLGNVQTSERNYPALQQASYKIRVTLKQKETSIGYITSEYSTDMYRNMEYYDPKNIYYYLGYWPDEYYSLGICYILSDGTVTSSFPLLGQILTLNEPTLVNESNQILESSSIIDKTLFKNTAGVFKLPKVDIINHDAKTVNPLYFEFQFSQEAIDELLALGVEGYFFTRTKRIPNSLFQGFSVGIDPYSGIPLPYISTGIKTGYIAESFLSNDRVLNSSINEHLRSTDVVNNSALLSLDVMVNPQLQSLLSWNEYTLQKDYECKLESASEERKCDITTYTKPEIENNLSALLVYIEKNIPSFKLDKYYFSTKTGVAESTREFSFFKSRDIDAKAKDLLRGVYCPIIGTNIKLDPSSIYTVKTKINNEISWIQTLMNSNYPYFSITNRYRLTPDTFNQKIEAYRGDCFTSTVTIRINRNFLDPTVPGNNEIIDSNTWKNNYNGSEGMSDKEDSPSSWTNINLSDLNAVPLGIWVTYKCLSNYNLGLRSIDARDIDLLNKIGGKGTFYPISGLDTRAAGKVPESQVLNEGYSVVLSRNLHTKWISTPYENWNFENRIAFSNVAATKMFTNGFRIFQGMAYQDVDKQFGQIIKLFPYGQNLLCVFEHGLAIIPINEKALLSTQEGLSIHLYGAGVLQEQVSVISPDYGSTWIESLIQTPNAYYGVDTSAKKIWKYNHIDGFTCISDFKIQSFLNEKLQISFDDVFFIGATNVRTHYNNFKGDVIFTFYNNDKAYSLCYNELTKTWVSRYTWMPLLSANIDNKFYSFDKDSIFKYASLFRQTLKTNGIICENPIYDKKVIFKYNGIVPAELKIKSISYKDREYFSEEIFAPILRQTDEGTIIQGIYYPNGLKGLFYSGGSILENLTLNHKPLYGEYTLPIYLYSEKPPTNEMIPTKTFVYYRNNQLTVTPQSKHDWSTKTPSLYDGWYYITTNVNLKPQTDSDGNIWFTTIITDGWSEPKIFNTNSVSSDKSEWKLITSHDAIAGDTYDDIKMEDNEILPLCYISTGNKIGDLEYISSVPMIVEPPISDDEDYDDSDIYEEKSLYSSYLWYDPNSNEYNVYIPNYFIKNDTVNITLEAWYDGQVIEECTYIISDHINTTLNLYKHDIDSPISKWYEKPEPFEYEFIVNQPAGFHKIFNNLMIISNNVEPESLEVELVGDSYDFKEFFKQTDENIRYKFPIISLPDNKVYQTKLILDKVTDEHRLLMHQDCLNIKDFGRRLGNISYIEGKWYVVLQPIYYEDKTLKTTRLRDKWAKIRIKYSGEKLAIITAIQTLMNISYG